VRFGAKLQCFSKRILFYLWTLSGFHFAPVGAEYPPDIQHPANFSPRKFNKELVLCEHNDIAIYRAKLSMF